MGELAEEAVLLLLSSEHWRSVGFRGDGAPAAICAARLAESWASGGPPPDAGEFRHGMTKQTHRSVHEVIDPLVAAGRVEVEGGPPGGRVGRLRSMVHETYWRVRDAAARQAVAERVAASLGGTTPPPLGDALLAAVLFTSKQWEKTGFDGPEPRPRLLIGSAPQPWGPLGTCAQQLATGSMVPAGISEPDVLPMIAGEVHYELMFHLR